MPLDARIQEAHVRPCRDCGARLFFAETPSGRIAPIDAAPSREGVYVLLAWGIEYAKGRSGPLYMLERADRETLPEEPRYLAHHATCTARKAKT